MSAHAFRIHAVVCSNALLYFQYLGQNAREFASRDAEIMVVAHGTDAEAPRTVMADALADVVVEVTIAGSGTHRPGLEPACGGPDLGVPHVLSEVGIVGAAYEETSYLAARDIPALAMVHVKPSSAEARLLRDTNDYHEEFHLRGRPFVVHPRGSHKHPFRSMPLSAPFNAATESYLGSLGRTGFRGMRAG